MNISVPWLLLLAATLVVGSQKEHKVPYIHNIVLYPDKHSWCKTTEIKQIVAYPGCSSVEIDNNVCVGACFSYSIPKTLPSAPGEVIVPYCDSCQPANTVWKEVKLNCTDDSEEVEMTKQVQVITNCTCTSCSKQYETNKQHEHHKKHDDLRHDVPELMHLMIEKHNTKYQVKNLSEEETKAQEEKVVPAVHNVLELSQLDQLKKELEARNSKDSDDEKDVSSQEEEATEQLKTAEVDENDTETEEEKKMFLKNLEKLHLERKENHEIEKLKGSPKHTDVLKEHYVVGPHHSFILKHDGDETHIPVTHIHHKNNDDEEVPSLLANQAHVHDNEEILDQLAVESVKKEEKEVFEIPRIIYQRANDTIEKMEVDNMTKKDDNKDEKWASEGELMVDVDHHHLSPAEEGVEVSYVVRDKPHDRK